MSGLLAGAAKVCMNPPEEMFPIPSSFADWGEEPLLQTAVYDDVCCRALVLKTNTDTVLIMTFELMGYPGAPGLESLLSEETGIPVGHIFLCGTHNHSAPKDFHTDIENNSPAEVEFHEKYWVVERHAAVRAAREAIEALRPARYAYGEGKSYVNVNRDVQTPYGFWIEGKNFEGYSDKTIRAVKIVDEDGKLIAAILNYGMHNTCVHMMKDADGRSKTSGNVSGIACRYVEEAFGGGAVALWTSGAAGNQNPLFSHSLQYEYPDGYSTTVAFPDGVGYMLMEYNGRLHGVDCVKCLRSIQKYSENLPIRSVTKNVFLPGQKRRVALTSHTMFRMGGHGLRGEGDVPVLPEVPEMEDADPVRLEMRLLIMGDIAMICAAGELYAEIGRDVLEAFPMKKAFIVTHTGRDKAGYILDKTSKDKKVFQAFSRVKPGCSDELIVNNALDMFEMVKEEE